MSLVSSNILRLLASGSSMSGSASTFSSNSRLIFGTGDTAVGDTSETPFVFAKCAASAASNSARRSRGWSASPPWPG